MVQIEFRGRLYTLDKETGYYRNDATRKRLHVAVWENHHGRKVPKGHHVHHRDENKENNTPRNLECLLGVDHLRHHWATDRERMLVIVRANQRLATEAAKAWHAGAEGREFHSYLGRLSHERNTPKKKKCEQCGAPFEDRSIAKQGKFCGPNCRARELRARRRAVVAQ